MLDRRTLSIAIVTTCGLLGGCAAQYSPPGGLAAEIPGASLQVRRDELAMLDQAIADVASLEYDAARAKLAELVQRFEASGDDVRAAEAMFWLSYCHEKAGRTTDARILYRRMVDKYPHAPASDQARARLGWLDARSRAAPGN